MTDIWQQLPTPIWCLAPMYGATDSAFRRLLVLTGRPDLMFTEFTHVRALLAAGPTPVRQLVFTAAEQPLIAQVWGQDPELFTAAADRLVRAGFAGLDINMGCPEKAVIKKGAGAALINNPGLAGKIIAAAVRGTAGRIPVSVKTRLGWHRPDFSWIDWLLRQKLDALIIHGRTAEAMSHGPVAWEPLVRAVAMRNSLRLGTKIIINGDLFTRREAGKRLRQTGADGVMIGRGVFRDPYIFSRRRPVRSNTKAARLELLRLHLDIYRQTWGERGSYHRLKRFIKIYVRGFPGAVAWRARLMTAVSIPAARTIIDT